MADYFEVGQDKVRIGLISFNRKVTRILQLSDVQNKADLDAAVDSIPYNGKGTNTGRALQEVVDNAFVEKYGDRADVENQVRHILFYLDNLTASNMFHVYYF